MNLLRQFFASRVKSRVRTRTRAQRVAREENGTHATKCVTRDRREIRSLSISAARIRTTATDAAILPSTRQYCHRYRRSGRSGDNKRAREPRIARAENHATKRIATGDIYRMVRMYADVRTHAHAPTHADSHVHTGNTDMQRSSVREPRLPTAHVFALAFAQSLRPCEVRAGSE